MVLCSIEDIFHCRKCRLRCDFDVGCDPFGSSMGNIDLFWGFVGCIGGLDFGENFSNLVKKSVVLINLERISICILILLMSLDCALMSIRQRDFCVPFAEILCSPSRLGSDKISEIDAP